MKGVLLINLGSPDSPTAKDVKPYLDEFLMDERVIDLHPIWRNLLVRGIILNTRPRKSAHAYSKIWWDEGSPLIVISQRFTDKIKERCDMPISLGMRYGSMSIKEGLQELKSHGVNEVLLVPLYPHYAMSSYETVVVKAFEEQKKIDPNTKLSTLPAFYRVKSYIEVLSKSIKEHIGPFDPDHILFSYHGIPERHLKKSDPTKFHCAIDNSCCKTNSVAHHSCYRHQCYRTTDLVAEQLNLKPGKFSTSFQSRLTKDPWLRPYTDTEFERLAEEGVKKLAVITPAFVSDCLETLEEIAMEGKDGFIKAGGQEFIHVPCLNDRDDWADVMSNWIRDWSESGVLP